jgi:hypothetical protein
MSAPVRSTIASPVAIARPSRPNHSPASAIATHSAVVTAGQGDTMASAGAKKNPSPTYHDDPARSDFSTNRNHRGICGIVCCRWLSIVSSCRCCGHVQRAPSG